MFVAAIATLFAACSTDDAADQAPVAPGKIEVSLNAALPESRAQINVDETNGRFTGAWEATDIMTVLAKGSASGEEAAQFTYDASSKVFKGQLTDATQDWTYQAVYPYVAAAGAEHKIPFGAARTQKGNNFNGDYDPLVSAPVTHQGSAPGKTPQGEAVTFGLNRLTAILAVTFTTDDASVKSEKVKTVVLTAADGKMIAAKTFDIDKSAQSGALGADEQSDAITLSYEEGSEPTAESFKAYFNVPAANYGKLTATITTEGHTATLDLSNGVELTAGELAYTTKPVSGWQKQGLNVSWETNPTFEPVEITSDMTGKCNIVINAPAGIKAFTVSMLSDYLNNDIGLTELDLLKPQGLETIFDILKFPYGEKILNQTTVPFDLTNAVALLEGQSGEHIFTMNVTDNNKETINQAITFFIPKLASVTVSDIDLWKNTATVTLNNAPEGATVQYKRSTETEWKNTTKNPNGTFSITPSWITEKNDAGKTIYSLDKNCGVFASATYDWQILNEEAVIASGTFETSAGDLIENGDMSQWCETKEMPPLFFGAKIKVWYPGSSWSNSTPGFWDSSNNAGNKTACTQDKTKNASCAWLQASGVSAVGALASGSLFTGTFTYASMNGTASFGQKYTYTARPTALRLKYHATLGTVNYNMHSGPIEKDKDIMDQCSFTVCIVDWDTRHDVQSGTSTPNGIWDPITMGELPVEKQNEIIGYGVKYSSENTPGTDLIPLEIPIKYYQQTSAAPDGKNKFTIIISVSTSRYGDYLNGCDKNKIYVDDFEWVY